MKTKNKKVVTPKGWRKLKKGEEISSKTFGMMSNGDMLRVDSDHFGEVFNGGWSFGLFERTHEGLIDEAVQRVMDAQKKFSAAIDDLRALYAEEAK